MGTTMAIVGAAILAKAGLITAIVVQRRRIRRDDAAVREQQQLTHLARVAIVVAIGLAFPRYLMEPGLRIILRISARCSSSAAI